LVVRAPLLWGVDGGRVVGVEGVKPTSTYKDVCSL